MHDRALEHIGQGGEPDMGMGRQVDSLARRKLHWAYVVEKDEGPDITMLDVGENAADF